MLNSPWSNLLKLALVGYHGFGCQGKAHSPAPAWVLLPTRTTPRGPIHKKPFGIGRLPFFGAGPLRPPRGSEGNETESRGHLNVQIGAGPDLRSKHPWGRIGWGPHGTSPLPAARRLVRRGAKVQRDTSHHTFSRRARDCLTDCLKSV